MPGPAYIGQFGNPWTSMGGIMGVRQQIHDQQMDQNQDVRAKQQQAFGQQQKGIGTMMDVAKGYQGLGGDEATRIGNLKSGIQAYDALLELIKSYGLGGGR